MICLVSAEHVAAPAVPPAGATTLLGPLVALFRAGCRNGEDRIFDARASFVNCMWNLDATRGRRVNGVGFAPTRSSCEPPERATPAVKDRREEHFPSACMRSRRPRSRLLPLRRSSRTHARHPASERDAAAATRTIQRPVRCCPCLRDRSQTRTASRPLHCTR